jgi:hypothetical protein
MSRSTWALVCLSFVALSCADQRPVISRVQPNAIDKSMLDGEWYAQQTIVEVPAALTASVVGESQFPGMTRVRWDIQEDFLYARRSYELVLGTDADGAVADATPTEDGQPYLGAIVAAFRIESHFDIVREYNATTGERINVVVENTSDRPWWERRFMRVDWSQNLVTDYAFYADDEVTVAPVPFTVQEEDPNEDDRPHFEDGYFDVTTALAVTPAVIHPDWATGPIPTCWLYYRDEEDCATTVVKVRNSYVRVDPDRQYEPAEYDGAVTEAFGFFANDRLVNDDRLGVREPARRRVLDRHNIWQRWVDDAGDPIPPAEREVRPIVYYLNADWPAELRGVAEAVAAEWNDALRAAVKADTGWSDATTPDVFVLCPNDPVAEGDPEACGPAGTHARVGDIRYSHLFWVRDWYDGMRLLGMGPSNADPLTGEILSGNAYIYVYNDTAAEDVQEMVRLLNGEISPVDYIDGVDLEDWVAEVNDDEAADAEESWDDADVASMWQAMRPAWAEGLPHADASALPKGGMGRSEMGGALSGLLRAGAFDPSREPKDALLGAIRGTTLESRMMNDEVLMAAGVAPGTALTEDVLDRASIARGGLGGALAGIERWRLELGRRGWDVAEMADDAMLGLARDLRGRSDDEVWTTARERIVHAVAAHELGHSLGLMHNFSGSEDVFNYDPEYWRLRTNDFTTDPRPRYLDPVTEAQIDGRIYDHAYSSIMDYAGRLTIDGAGVGRYDRAAMLFGYAGKVEVFEDTGDAEETDLADYWSTDGSPLRLFGSGPQAIHYTDWYRMMGDRMWRDDNRRVVPVSELETDLGAWVDPASGTRHARVPYLYCSHNRADISDGCLTRDFGADPYERMHNHLEGLETWYVMRSFSRGRYGFSPESYVGRAYARSYLRMKGFNDVYALYAGLLGTFYDDAVVARFFSDPTSGWGNYTVAVHDAFNALARTLTMPDVGSYAPRTMPDGTQVLALSGGTSAQLDVSRARYFTTSWTDSAFDSDCGYYWWECLHHVGFYLDKMMALLALSDTETHFVARDTAADARTWRISFYDDFGPQITDLVGGVLSEDYAGIAPWFDPATGDLAVRDFADPALDPIGEEPPSGFSPVDSATGFTVRLYSAVLGATRFHNDFDQSFPDSLRMWMAGNGHSIDAPTVSYAHAATGRTYVALDLPDGMAARVIDRANALAARSVDEALGESARLEAGGALARLKDDLDVLVDLTGAMDSSGEAFEDPL